MNVEIATICALAVAVVVLAGVLGVLIHEHQSERTQWTAERRSLVNRAIAQHSGEIIALDRSDARNDRPVEPKVPTPEILPEGLS